MLHMGLEARFLCIFPTNSSKRRAGEILECGGNACILKGGDDGLRVCLVLDNIHKIFTLYF